MRVHSHSQTSAASHANGGAHGAAQATPMTGVTPPFAAAMAQANSSAGEAPKGHKVGGQTHVTKTSTHSLSHSTTTSLARASAPMTDPTPVPAAPAEAAPAAAPATVAPAALPATPSPVSSPA